MKNTEGYLQRVKPVFESAYNDGFESGFARAKELYAQRGVAHCCKATPEEIKTHGTELWGWCDCGKPIIGRWAGLANFCPWCGKIIGWEEPALTEAKGV